MQIDFDVLVIGGGTAGVIAAVQAGRASASVLLVEKNEMLGGTITNARIDFPGLFHAWTCQVIKGIGWELVKKCVDEGNLSMPDFSKQETTNHWREHIRINPFLFAVLCDEAVTEAGVTPLFNSMIADIKEKEDYKRIKLCTKTGLKTVTAKTVIDCTGDANAVAIAGYEVYKSDNCQPATYVCRASGYDLKTVDFKSLQEEFQREVIKGSLEYTDIGRNKNHFSKMWLQKAGDNANHINIDGVYADTSEGRTSFAIKGRASILRIYRFLKKHRGLENLSIDYIAPECGIRESNRIKGKKTITLNDYINGKKWDDAVCYSFYPIDLHINSEDGLYKKYLEDGVIPSIPRGAMLPENSQNMIVAGRCVSSDQLANSALRSQASCMAMGQAAGAMAAIGALSNQEVSSIPMNSIHSLLKKHGAIVPGNKMGGS